MNSARLTSVSICLWVSVTYSAGAPRRAPLVSLLLKAQPRDYRHIHQAADGQLAAVRRAILDAVGSARDDLPWGEIRDGIARGDWRFIATILGAVGTVLTPLLRRALERVVVDAGQAAVTQLPSSIQAQMQFDLTNPHAVTAIDQQVAAVVRDLHDVNETALLTILRQGFTNGVPPLEMARRMRSYIGLTPQYAQAVERYRAGLVEQQVSPSRVDSLVTAYAERLTRLRAVAIARTETIRAANAGQQAAWQDAKEAGLLDAGTARRIWIVTPDDLLCPICEAIPDMNPDGVGLDESFRTELGAIDLPPAHPACRCAVGLEFGT